MLVQDKGLNILYRGLRHTSDVTIDYLQLINNGVTRRSSSLLSELTVKCKVKTLWINGNDTIGEDQQLYSMLTNPSTELEELIMSYTSLSSRGAILLFTAVKENNKLKKLFISNNDITDDACDVITTALQRNSCLVGLYMSVNPLSSEAIINIVRCLEGNNTIQVLGLPLCLQDIQENIRSLLEVVSKKRESRGCQENIKSLQEVVNKKRESRGCQVKLEIRYG